MISWFTVKLKYTKQLDNGTLKRVTEPYLVAAMTFTDAEARIYEEMGNAIRGEFTVSGISRTEVHDIFSVDGSNVWFKCKVSYESADDDGGKAKKINQYFLTEGTSVKDACENLIENISDLMVDYKIISVAESPILEIFPPNQVADVPEKTNKSDSTMVPSAEFDSEVADEYSNNE
jgi:hypothetical protein